MNLIDVKVNLVLFNHKMQGVMLTCQNGKYYLLSNNSVFNGLCCEDRKGYQYSYALAVLDNTFQHWCELHNVTPVRKFNHES